MSIRQALQPYPGIFNMAEEPEGLERFDEARVRQILRRAIEIDDRADAGIDAAELQAIAASVGIRAEALDQAIEELRHEDGGRKRRISLLRRVRRMLTVATSAIFGLLATMMTALLGNGSAGTVMFTAVAPMALIVLMLLFYNRNRGNQLTYQIDNVAMWVAFVFLSRSVAKVGGIVPPGAIAWFILAVLGVLVIGRKQSEPPGLSQTEIVERAARRLQDRSGPDGLLERRGLPARTQWRRPVPDMGAGS